MTLSELAALASKTVLGFERPQRACLDCHNRYDVVVCSRCGDTDGLVWDDSPAALLMAAVMWACGSRWRDVLFTEGVVQVSGERRTQFGMVRGGASPESIARAALVALLAAHGVEVP